MSNHPDGQGTNDKVVVLRPFLNLAPFYTLIDLAQASEASSQPRDKTRDDDIRDDFKRSKKYLGGVKPFAIPEDNAASKYMSALMQKVRRSGEVLAARTLPVRALEILQEESRGVSGKLMSVTIRVEAERPVALLTRQPRFTANPLHLNLSLVDGDLFAKAFPLHIRALGLRALNMTQPTSLLDLCPHDKPIYPLQFRIAPTALVQTLYRSLSHGD